MLLASTVGGGGDGGFGAGCCAPAVLPHHGQRESSMFLGRPQEPQFFTGMGVSPRVVPQDYRPGGAGERYGK